MQQSATVFHALHPTHTASSGLLTTALSSDSSSSSCPSASVHSSLLSASGLQDSVALIPGITPSGQFQFRRGQYEFLTKLADALRSGERNHLGVFVPGYGKTITAIASFLVARALCVAQKLVVFVPRGNLRDQYANPQELSTLLKNLGAPPLTFCVADSERAFLKNLHTDVIITTYQYASGRSGSQALRHFCSRSLCMFVFDEVHHLSEDGSWAATIKTFPFACSVALSGTPMRSDNKSLFGVPVEVRTGSDGRQTQFYQPLHEVLLRDAHAEGGILKRVAAHVIDYNIKLKHTDTGEIVEMSLSRLAEQASSSVEVDAFLARKKLRFHEVYLETLLRPAFERFTAKRHERNALAERYTQQHQHMRGSESAQQHQMLVIAMSNAHAAAILEFIQRQFPQYSAARIGQDIAESERSKTLKAYRQGTIDVMVQVDMIGEGTDIKPISVIVKADLVRALSKTLQQIFRGMRFYPPFGESGNVCDIFTSNDAEVVQILEWLTSEEQMGITLKTKRLHEQRRSHMIEHHDEAWELLAVEHQETETHALELFEGFMRPTPVLKQKGRKKQESLFVVNSPHHAIQQALDVAARERALRQECSVLAVKLAHILPKSPQVQQSSAISQIHAAAIKRFSKPQESMSVSELLQKRDWLAQCIRARRLL
jgi:superfamily II DNA or RNA helicase